MEKTVLPTFVSSCNCKSMFSRPSISSTFTANTGRLYQGTKYSPLNSRRAWTMDLNQGEEAQEEISMEEFEEQMFSAVQKPIPEELAEFPPDVPILNKVILVGRLGADPELRTISSTLSVCKFSLAVQDDRNPSLGPNQETTTSWFNVEAWGSLGKSIANRGRKGLRVGIKGRFDVSRWVGRDGVERRDPVITAKSFEILQSKSEQDSNSQFQQKRNTGQNDYGKYSSEGQKDSSGRYLAGDEFPF